MRRAGGKLRVEVPGENLGSAARRTVVRKLRVRHEVQIAIEWAVVTVSADRGPSGKQRPHAAEVITGWCVERVLIRDDARSPVGLMVGRSNDIEEEVALVLVGEAEPKGHGSEHTRLVDATAAVVDREREEVLLGRPE